MLNYEDKGYLILALLVPFPLPYLLCKATKDTNLVMEKKNYGNKLI